MAPKQSKLSSIPSFCLSSYILGVRANYAIAALTNLPLVLVPMGVGEAVKYIFHFTSDTLRYIFGFVAKMTPGSYPPQMFFADPSDLLVDCWDREGKRRAK